MLHGENNKAMFLSQNCHFYSYILIVHDVEFFACLETFSSKFNCVMIEIFGAVKPIFCQFVVIEFFPLDLEQKSPCVFV